MSDFVILGTDTDAGKTTFALLWLSAFADRWEYWKPIETGESDSARLAALRPSAIVHAPLCRFSMPAAPLLAARAEGATVPTAREIVAALPRTLDDKRGLVIETFGGAFSPLTDDELQLALIRALDRPVVLVSSSKLGGIGRTLQSLAALNVENIEPIAVVLVGPNDPFTLEQVCRHRPGQCVIALEAPGEWTMEGIAACAARQRGELQRLHGALTLMPGPSPGGRREQTLLADDRRSVWHPYTPLIGADEPLACVGAQDEFLELADGRRVIDAISSWWTILHGHRHPPLMRALADAQAKIDHVLFAGVTHPYAVELADLLLGTMPWCGGRVFYSDNGSTAVEVALKMAYQYWCHRGEPQRTSFVGFEHGYHGDTFGAMSVGRDPLFFGRFEPLMFRAEHCPVDPDQLDQHLQQHAGVTAAVIIEPLVQGAGGMRMHSPETLRAIAEVTRRHGLLLIVDEVMTGGGRTGTLWAHQAALPSPSVRGVGGEGTPDLVCAAKTLTGGILPLAATLVSPRVVEAFQTADRTRTFFHGHSFTANPLACAVAVCNYRKLLGATASTVAQVGRLRYGSSPLAAPRRMEKFWLHSLQLLRQHPRVKEVRIRGSIAAVKIDVPGGYLADVGRTMRNVCLAHGVMLRPLGNVLYAMPPFCTSDDSLAQIVQAMTAAIENV
ncbi:MAG: adenosylmethionine--8-amino-7-oxononanoate transaminase [Planctomycetes bacterium]|nr:adenosylmethionine--8-amino-7-oxononanoate transaminase [Planctomycetota bacterium]